MGLALIWVKPGGHVRFGSLADMSGIDAAQAIDVQKISSITRKSACFCKLAPFIDCRHIVTRRKRHDFRSLAVEVGIGSYKKRIYPLFHKRRERCLDLAFVTGP